LMVAALEAARDFGYRQVSLTVHPQNPAIALYESCGFEKREIRNTYHLMVAKLALFEGEGFRAVEMRAEDVPRVARFHAANPDYFMIVYGEPAPAGEAQSDFDARLPEGFPHRRTWMLLFEDPAGSVIGVASLVQDLFAAGVWNVGLFITAAALHGNGTPHAMYHALEAWMKIQGARWLRLGVVDANKRGAAFWKRMGYTQVRQRENYVLGPRTHLLHVMVKPLADADWDWYRRAVPRDDPASE
jgi:ribosomal protein S18 acetylase RimI-like enzyme